MFGQLRTNSCEQEGPDRGCQRQLLGQVAQAPRSGCARVGPRPQEGRVRRVTGAARKPLRFCSDSGPEADVRACRREKRNRKAAIEACFLTGPHTAGLIPLVSGAQLVNADGLADRCRISRRTGEDDEYGLQSMMHSKQVEGNVNVCGKGRSECGLCATLGVSQGCQCSAARRKRWSSANDAASSRPL